ncbi:4343_t:CDS:2 [Acaulospora colombiana]|uniref:4343_t:CDS:1 n=1 Tax=Acaulospora colombiana TaxID=27376 RepID=A0ACA9LVG7_9GLOM|nr:4343_t:CDS:2 [Acaulospora colombiana]
MAQYRPLVMLVLGITFIYWIISLHSAPYPYPQNIVYAQDVIFGNSGFLKPDEVFIYVQDGWVYLTAMWKEYESGLVDDVFEWQLLYIHRLRGPITHVSSYYHKNNPNPTSDSEYNEDNALAILYQIQANEEIQYILRLYNLGDVENKESDLDDPGKVHR